VIKDFSKFYQKAVNSHKILLEARNS